MKWLEAKPLADGILAALKKEISHLDRPPGLAFILVGDNTASKTYVSIKRKKCQELGFYSKDIFLEEKATQFQLHQAICELNKDPKIDGILMQLPLPSHLSAFEAIEQIDPTRDVDGFHPLNLGKLLLGETSGFIPCTPFGIYQLLHYYHIPLEGKHVVIVGRSNIVGKPLAALLMQKHQGANATVTLAHSRTSNLKTLCKTADILVAAIGSMHFIDESYISHNATVVDVGIHKAKKEDGLEYVTGDVNLEKVKPHCCAITPVPGGVGPMTISMLLFNTYLSYLKKHPTYMPRHLALEDNLLVRF